jgi:hypothetical protein
LLPFLPFLPFLLPFLLFLADETRISPQKKAPQKSGALLEA